MFDSDIKKLFKIKDQVVYLNCSYMSPSLKSVENAGLEAVKLKSSPWNIKPEDFFNPSNKLRSLIAQLIDSDTEDIALIPSVSYGIETAIKNIDLKENDKILLLAEQFPSNVYPWLESAKRSGAELVFVEKNKQTWTEAVLEALDSNVKVLALPNVHWTNGARLDLKEINEKRKKLGAYLVLDLTQSLGALAYSVKEVDADFVVSAGYKWMLGPYSLAYLYVSPKFHDGIPLENNWISRKNSEDFSGLVNYEPEYQEGAERFDMGERSNFVGIPMATEAVSQILDWGVDSIANEISKLINRVNFEAANLGLEILSDHEQSPHMTGITFNKGVPEKLIEEFKKNHIFLSIRGKSIRISPHLYNNNKDIDIFLDLLKRYTNNS